MPIDEQGGKAAWTVLKTVQWTADYFNRYGLDAARTDAEILLAHVLGCQRIDLYLHHDQPLHDDELNAFKQLIKRRIKREPVAYIVGYKEFWSLRYRVTPDVLIPRPDTECLVEKVLEHIPLQDETFLVELGVGSGAISIALAKERPSCQILATDRSVQAAAIARENALSNGVADQVEFLVAHWLLPFPQDKALFDMVVSNPPYIAREALDVLAKDIRAYEPIQALHGGEDGLLAIREIVSQAEQRLRPGGLIFLEIGYDQGAAVVELVQQFDSYTSTTVHKDLAGHDRVVQIQKRGA